MKKALLIVCIVTLLLTLTACDPSQFRFDYDEMKASVIRVEYIYYNNPNAKEIHDSFAVDKSKLHPFDFNKMEIREVLSGDKVEAFLKDLATNEYLLMGARHLNAPRGDSIRLVYNNGDFEILSVSPSQYSGSFSASGEVKRFIGGGIPRAFFERWFIA